MYRMLVIIIKYKIINVWDIFVVFTRLPRIFLYTNNGFVMLPWTSFISHVHTILISSSGAGAATSSPCGVWCREWTTYVLQGGVILEQMIISMRVCYWRGVCYWFLVFIHVFLTTLPKFWSFCISFQINLTKCCVQSYSIDVILARSSHIYHIHNMIQIDNWLLDCEDT